MRLTEQVVQRLRLLSEIHHDGAACGNHVLDLALDTNLAKAAPLAEHRLGWDGDEVDRVLIAQLHCALVLQRWLTIIGCAYGLNQGHIVLLIAVSREAAQASSSVVKCLCALVESSAKTIGVE